MITLVIFLGLENKAINAQQTLCELLSYSWLKCEMSASLQKDCANGRLHYLAYIPWEQSQKCFGL